MAMFKADLSALILLGAQGPLALALRL
jgi:hypothetical protein